MHVFCHDALFNTCLFDTFLLLTFSDGEQGWGEGNAILLQEVTPLKICRRCHDGLLVLSEFFSISQLEEQIAGTVCVHRATETCRRFWIRTLVALYRKALLSSICGEIKVFHWERGGYLATMFSCVIIAQYCWFCYFTEYSTRNTVLLKYPILLPNNCFIYWNS